MGTRVCRRSPANDFVLFNLWMLTKHVERPARIISFFIIAKGKLHSLGANDDNTGRRVVKSATWVHGKYTAKETNLFRGS